MNSETQWLHNQHTSTDPSETALEILQNNKLYTYMYVQECQKYAVNTAKHI